MLSLYVWFFSISKFHFVSFVKRLSITKFIFSHLFVEVRDTVASLSAKKGINKVRILLLSMFLSLMLVL